MGATKGMLLLVFLACAVLTEGCVQHASIQPRLVTAMLLTHGQLLRLEDFIKSTTCAAKVCVEEKIDQAGPSLASRRRLGSHSINLAALAPTPTPGLMQER